MSYVISVCRLGPVPVFGLLNAVAYCNIAHSLSMRIESYSLVKDMAPFFSWMVVTTDRIECLFGSKCCYWLSTIG